MRAARRAAIAGGTLLAAGVTTAAIAVAIPPGGAATNPCGAVVTVSPNPVASGTTVSFTGTGFAAGEEMSVKLDDGSILNGSGLDVLTTAKADGGGNLTGAINLTNISSSTPVTAGAHSLRLLNARQCSTDGGDPKGHSVKSEFEVSGGTTTDPGQTTTTTPPSTTPPQVTTPAPDGTKVTLVVASRSLTLTTPKKPKTSKKGAKKKTSTPTASLKIRAAAGGGSGRVTVVTSRKFTVTTKAAKGKKAKTSKAARRQLFRTAQYYVEPGRSVTVKLRLSDAGAQIFRRNKAVQATVTLRDATGARVAANVRVSR